MLVMLGDMMVIVIDLECCSGCIVIEVIVVTRFMLFYYVWWMILVFESVIEVCFLC